ncbi:hypothetical protein EGT07_15615 [Herbaspirillum sp. HC18]|nr:hypothetical protein EGT07_15615 [Herbaspirillum sp. HC18]
MPRVAYPALPPASVGTSAPSSETASAPGPARTAPAASPASAKDELQPQEQQGVEWTFPHIRLGGSLSYDIRSDSDERHSMVQRGLIATATAATETFIWQPWFAQLGGNLRLSSTKQNNSRNDTEFGGSNTDLSGLIVTGAAQLRILPHSTMPFEAHIERNDTRTTSELISVGNYSGQRIGFTQQYMRQDGDALIGFDRSTQTSDFSGRDRQDSLQLSMTHNLEDHRFSVLGTSARNTRENTGERTIQDNITFQHNYSPMSELTVDTTANVGKAGYKLLNGESDTRLSQLSSMAFYRPEEMPLTVMGGVRLLTLASQNSGNDLIGPSSADLRNANVNLGATYDLTQFVHLNGTANANSVETGGQRIMTTGQSAGVTYQPETIRFDNGVNYNWSASSTLSNRTGGPDAGQQLVLQLSHNLNRSFELDEGSVLTFELNQALTGMTAAKGPLADQAATKQMTNGGAVSWNVTMGAGSAMVRLSASDSRALDGNKEYFQLINLQASSNLPTGAYTSWNGNLTIQAVRQGGLPPVVISPDTGLPVFLTRNTNDGEMNITSSGSLTYQNNRFFGVRQLRFTSDLRLNGQSLLPILGGPQDQELAAWDNRWDYFIGRTQLRFAAMIARTKSPVFNSPLVSVPRANDPVRVQRSVMFTVSRQFGEN